MKYDISVLDALRSLIDYAEEENLPAAQSALMSMLEDISLQFDQKRPEYTPEILPFIRRKIAS